METTAQCPTCSNPRVFVSWVNGIGFTGRCVVCNTIFVANKKKVSFKSVKETNRLADIARKFRYLN